MCVSSILELLLKVTEGLETDGRESFILDFCAGKGVIGNMLKEQGFEHVYGQTGQSIKRNNLLRKGYTDVETFIVGKQGVPKTFRRKFDFVTCAEGLGTGLMPARGFEDMLSTLKPGGFCIFTMSQKHLKDDSMFATGYALAIKKLIDRNLWRPIIHR